MDTDKNGKIDRVLGIYAKLMKGHTINKASLAHEYGVNERSIQRDIEDIRNFIEVSEAQEGACNSVVYDRREKGYRLDQAQAMKLTNSEILAISKILLESRAFTKAEMSSLLDRLIAACVPKENVRLVDDLIKNEEFHYVEPRHGDDYLDKLWEIGQAIRACNYIQIDYRRNKDKQVVSRKLKPLALMFSEYYFYLTAFIDDQDEVRARFDVVNDSFPTIYRLDRIKQLRVLKEKFHIPYSSRFEEGEFRKRIQFMYGGKIQRTKFICSEQGLEAVRDRLPTAEIIEEKNGQYTIQAETFGKGIDMWLRSQGDNITIL